MDPGKELPAFAQLLDLTALQKLLDSFCETVGVASAIIDLSGKVIVASHWQRVCTEFHRKHPVTRGRCIESDTGLASQLREGDGFACYSCRNGLTDAASPIVVNGHHVANFFIGQFFTSAPDENFFKAQAAAFDFVLGDYLAAVAEVPVVSREKLPSILQFLTEFAQLVARLTLDRQRSHEAEQALRQEREAAIALARESEEARAELARYQTHLEMMVQERTDQLLRSQKFLHLVLDTIPVGVFWKDTASTYLGGNATWLRDTGYVSLAETIGLTDHHMPWKQLAEKYRADDQEVMTCGHAKINFEEPAIAPNGQALWVRTSKMPLTNEHDEIIGVLGTYEDVTLQKEAQAALVQAKESAEAATRAKSDFLSAMSHEIRTPLNVIIGMTDILLESELAVEQRGYVEKLQVAGNNLLELINQILDISKIEAGQLHIFPEPVAVRGMMEEVSGLLGVVAKGKGISLTCRLSPRLPPYILADATRLRQILFNLLGNAVKFTEQGGVILEVDVVGENKPQLAIQVQDTGIGIPADHLAVIFDSFTQGDGGITRRFGGTGLGLTLARRLVELMAGRIRVQSTPGQGSTFHVTLPLLVADLPLSQPVLPVTEKALSQRGLNILLVEDSEDNQALIRTFLKGSPHHLTMADNGEVAVNMVQADHYDLVFMDVQMPVMDGYTATRRIRRWEVEQGLSPVPIIALTAHALEGEAERSRQAGCDFFLTKPIKKQRLLEAIHQIL